MAIKLSDHFTYKRLLKFTFPSIIMMMFMSIYGIIDGLFVSNFVGPDEFTALNFIYPMLMVLSSFGFMFGSGGNALISKIYGEGNKKKANEVFSLVVYTSVIIGIIISIIGLYTIKPIAILLGAKGLLLENCIIYAVPLIISIPFFMLQLEFQTFFNTAEIPTIGLICTICAGVLNVILDAILILVFKLGILGASIATVMSQVVGGLFPVIYFMSKNKSILRLGKTKFDIKALLKTVTNGSSELLSNVSMSLVGLLYNVQLLKFEGEPGVTAYGIMMYISLLLNAIFIGFSLGTAPIVGYNFGAKNHAELKGLLRKCICIISVFSVITFILSQSLKGVFAGVFVGYDEHLYNLTKNGFVIYSFSFLFIGLAIYFSSFFTALNDGLTSAIISFLRTLVFQIIFVIVLPLFMGVNGIWLSIVLAELSAVVVSLIFLFIKRKRYNY